MRVWTRLMVFGLAALVCAGLGMAACGDDGNECTPSCTGKACGDDGCGGTCAPGCDTGETCNAAGQCEGACEPDCAGKECGPDGCGGTCDPGCQAGETCNAQGQCEAGGVTPHSGIWHYDEWNPAVNVCNSDEVVSNGDGSFQLQDNGDGTFTITPGDGTDPFDCNLTGANFNCPQRAWLEVDLTGDGIDAVLQASVEVNGTFTDAEHISNATQDGQVTCTGVACVAAAAYLQTTFPCDITINFTAHWQL